MQVMLNNHFTHFKLAYVNLHEIGFKKKKKLFFVTNVSSDLLFQMPKQYPFNELYLENGGDPDKVPTIKHYTFEPAE